MSKLAYAMKANATEDLQDQLKTGIKRRTWKARASQWPDTELIENPDGHIVGSLSPGTNGAWLFITCDGLCFHRFTSKPDLAECIAVLN